MLKTQAALLSVFTAPPKSDISLGTPLVYSDRLRIRNPGDAKFALGPHIDGGSIERWEDPTYRQVYKKILEGKWEEFDAWEMGKFRPFWENDSTNSNRQPCRCGPRPISWAW